MRLLTLGLCLMVLLVPLACWPGLYEHELLPKQAALVVCLVVACLGWAWHREPVFPTHLLYPAGCLLVFGLLAGQASTNLLVTGMVLANLVTLIILALIVASVPVDRLRPVWWCLVGGGGIAALVGLLQAVGLVSLGEMENGPVGSTFCNRNLLAEYLICCIPVGFYLALTEKGAREGIAIALHCTMTMCLIVTGCRGAWVGIAAGACWWAYQKFNRWGFGLIVAGMLLVGGGMMALKGGEKSLCDPSVHERLAFWRGTVEMIADHPQGVGPGMWLSQYPPYDHGATITTIGYHRRPHNDYLWIAAEFGILGLVAYLWLLWRAFGGLRRLREDPATCTIGTALTVSLIALLVAACFGFPREQPATCMFQFIVIGVAAGMGVSSWRGRLSHLSLFLGLVFCLFSVYLAGVRLAFDRAYLMAGSACMAEDWQACLEAADRGRQVGVLDPDILYWEGVALENMGYANEAGAVYGLAVQYSPWAWYVHAGLARVRLRQGNRGDAFRHARIAYAICPGLMKEPPTK